MAEISLDNFLVNTETTAQPQQESNVISLDDFLQTQPKYPPLSLVNRKEIQDYWLKISEESSSGEDKAFGLNEFSLQETGNRIKKFMVGEKSELTSYIARGLGVSNIGLIKNYLEGKGLPEGLIDQQPEDSGWLEGFVQQLSTLGADLPFYALGAFAGSPIPKVGSTFGAAFVPGVLRKTMTEALNKQQIGEPIDFMKIVLEEGIKQGIKDGLQLTVALNAPKFLGPIGNTYIGKTLGRFTAFEGIGALMHGELPSARELSYSAILWSVGTKLEGNLPPSSAKTIKEKMDNIYIETGKKPTEVLKDAIVDRTVADDFASINQKIPRSFDKSKVLNKEEITLEQKVIDLKEQLKITQERKVPERTEKYIDAEGNDVTRIIIDQKASEKKTKDITKITDQIKYFEKQLETTAKSSDPAMQHMFDRMSFGEPIPEPVFKNIKEKIVKGKNVFIDTMLDFRNPILTDLVQVGAKNLNKVDVPINLYQEAMSLSRNKDLGYIFLKRGTQDVNKVKNGKSLSEILEPIGNDPVKMSEFSAYSAAVFNKTLVNRGVKTPFDIKFSEQVANNKTYKAKYETMRKEMVEFSDKVLQYVRDKGYITDKQYKAIKELNENYVPYAREFLEFERTVFKGKSFPLKRRKGDEELRVIDPVKTTIENTIKLIEIAEVNAYRLKYLELLKQNPEAFPGVKKKEVQMQPIKVQRKELEKSLNNIIPKEVLDSLSDAAIIEMTLFRPKQAMVDKNSMMVRTKEGKIEIWEVGEQRVLASNATLYKELDWLQTFSKPFTSLTRLGVVFAPVFALKNLFRDTVNASVMSKVGWIPIVDSFIGLARIIRGRTLKDTIFADKYAIKLMERWEKSGGMQNSIIQIDKALRETKINEVLFESGIKNQIRRPVKLLHNLIQVSEEMTRVRMFEKVEKVALQKGLTPKQAMERGGFEAADMMDYARTGSKLSYVNHLVPFFNPFVQGARKSVDIFAKNPKKAMAGVFTAIIMPTLLEQILYRDDPEYQQQPAQAKRDNWYVRINGIPYWIPKPFDIGTLFSELTKSIIDVIVDDDRGTWNGFVKSYFDSFINRTIPIPQFIKPFVEIGVNESFLFDQPIINPYLDRNVKDVYQAQKQTSQTMQILAQSLNGLIDSDWFVKMNNPIYLDHVFRSYFATIGGYILDISDKILAETGVVDKRFSPEKQIGDLAIARGIVAREVPWWTDYEQKFNDKLVELRKADGTIKFLQKQGRYAEAAKEQSKYPYDVKVLENIDKEIKKIDKAIINITNAKFEELRMNEADFNKLSKDQQEYTLLSIRQSKYEQIRNLRKMQILLTAAGLNAINIKVAIPEIK